MQTIQLGYAYNLYVIIMYCEPITESSLAVYYIVSSFVIFFFNIRLFQTLVINVLTKLFIILFLFIAGNKQNFYVNNLPLKMLFTEIVFGSLIYFNQKYSQNNFFIAC